MDRLLVVGCYFSNGFISFWTPARSGEALAPLLLATRPGLAARRGGAGDQNQVARFLLALAAGAHWARAAKQIH